MAGFQSGRFSGVGSDTLPGELACSILRATLISGQLWFYDDVWFFQVRAGGWGVGGGFWEGKICLMLKICKGVCGK